MMSLSKSHEENKKIVEDHDHKEKEQRISIAVPTHRKSVHPHPRQSIKPSVDTSIDSGGSLHANHSGSSSGGHKSIPQIEKSNNTVVEKVESVNIDGHEESGEWGSSAAEEDYFIYSSPPKQVLTEEHEIEEEEEMREPSPEEEETLEIIPIDPALLTAEEKFFLCGRYTKEEIDELSAVFLLRGYYSDACLPKSIEERIPELNTKSSILKKTRCLSMEDLILSSNGYTELVIGTLDKFDTRQYEISKNRYYEWRGLFDLKKNRFSYFDELFKLGYVIDSLEVPSKPDDLTYLVEADRSKYKTKVDYGRVVFKTKHVFMGNFINWSFQGPGRYTWTNGTMYQGDFKNGVMHGEGVLLWTDGSIYEGQFLQGIRAGWGVYSTAEGYTYAGDWFQGLPHGKGKMWYDPENDNGDYYDGDWAEGKPNGQGTRLYSNGDRFVGTWEHGIRSGNGSMVWLVNRQVYKGGWSRGVPHGKGQHVWYLKRTKNSNFPTRHIYQGDWQNGLRHGVGRMVYPCGSIYEGRWQHGQRHGRGMFINPAGGMLVGLFRMGSIMGGSQVPLHTPPYECDFSGLVEILLQKFGFNYTDVVQMTEEKHLRDITVRHLGQIRKLYKRAGTLGECWGNQGLYPEWMKTPKSSTVVNSRDRNQRRRNNTDKIEQNPKPKPVINVKPQCKIEAGTPDNVHPLTRFGFRLFMRDCPGILTDVTCADYDEIWNTIPSISYKTSHNPFEPIYLWQFLQCLVVIACMIYVEIPRRNDNLKGTRKQQIVSRKETVTNLSEQGSGSIHKDVSLSQNESEKNIPPLVLNPVPDNISKHDSIPLGSKLIHGKSQKINKEKNSLQQQQHEINTSGFPISMIETENNHNKLNPVLEVHHSIIEDEKHGLDTTAEEGNHESSLQGSVKMDGDEGHLHAFGDSDIMDKIETDDNKISNDQIPPLQQSIPEYNTIQISEAFEKLLIEKLIPCLNVDPGTNLPPIPDPLPSLADLYNSFITIHEGSEIISGIDFLQNVLPQALDAKKHNPIYWTRSKEILSPFVNLDDINKFYKKNFRGFGNTISLESIKSEFLGEKLSNIGLFSTKIKGGEVSSTMDGQKRTSVHIYGRGNKVFGINGKSDINEKTGVDQARGSQVDDQIESTLFSERDMVLEPFLWTQESKCISVPRKEKAFSNIKSHDVMKVLQYLSPRVAGQYNQINLGFRMTFCDWLFATLMIAKISADREFYYAIKKESLMDHIPFNRSGSGRPYSERGAGYNYHSAKKPDDERCGESQERKGRSYKITPKPDIPCKSFY